MKRLLKAKPGARIWKITAYYVPGYVNPFRFVQPDAKCVGCSMYQGGR